MGERKKMFVIMAACIVLLIFSVPATAREGADIRSWGNLVCESKDIGSIEFHSSDLVSLDNAIRQMQQEISEGRSQIVSALGVRGVAASGNATFCSMPDSIAAVEQKIYIGEQKAPAEIIYHYHDHEYDGKMTNDYYNHAIYETPGGCYTKEVYDGNGKLKGYTVGCGYVEHQIIGADIVEK